ncbi:MAG TPA: DUF192 domain-containing protein [Candidatus Binatia bacterium]|nr:DUF192 domain-containing protein [Candidatus Binatia bacterium]
MKKRNVQFALFVLLVLAGCDRGPSVVLHASDGPNVRIRVELATTPAAQAQGLMYRHELASDAGMLFIFPTDSVLHFWMKNTLIPLDMLFIDRDRRIVGIVEHAHPMSTEPVGPDQPARYVLEVNGGFAAQHRIAVGSTVEFVAVPEGAG